MDVVLAPVLPTPVARRHRDVLTIRGTPEPIAAAYVRPCVPASVIGLPALWVSCGIDADGLPLALRIMARPFDEVAVLRVGHAWRRATDRHDRRPPDP